MVSSHIIGDTARGARRTRRQLATAVAVQGHVVQAYPVDVGVSVLHVTAHITGKTGPGAHRTPAAARHGGRGPSAGTRPARSGRAPGAAAPCARRGSARPHGWRRSAPGSRAPPPRARAKPP